MASIQPVEREVEIYILSPKSRPKIIPTTKKADTESVSVKVENQVENQNSGSEQPAQRPSRLSKCGSFLTCYMPVPKPLQYLFFCLLFVLLAPVTYTCVTVATVAIFPLLIAGFLIVRFFQFVIRGEYLEKHFTIKFILHYWLFVDVVLLLIEVAIFYPIAKYSPGLKLVVIIGLPITHWLHLVFIVIGIYFLNQLVWLLILSVTILRMKTRDNEESGFIVLESISEFVSCLFFWWAESEVMNHVKTFNQHQMSNVYTRKWIEVSIFILMGFNIITLLTHMIAWSLPKVFPESNQAEGDTKHLNLIASTLCCDDLTNSTLNKRYVVYIANGIKRSIIFILTTLLLLLTWVLYFGDLLKTSEARRHMKIGTWTLFSVFVCSLLWLIKSCILLYREAHAVYDRLDTKIKDIGKQLYFLVLLSNTHFQAVKLTEQNSGGNDGCGGSGTQKKRSLWVLKDSEISEGEGFDRKTVRKELLEQMGPKASTYALQQAAQRFVTAKYALWDASLSTSLHHLQSDSPDDDNRNIEETLKEIVLVKRDARSIEAYSEADWNLLLKLLATVDTTTEELTLQKIKTWMERAHSRCRFLANTLSSEKEVERCLNHVISGIIVFAPFIMWLFISGLASTPVFTALGGALIASSIVFGETIKSFFQGLIFVYVIHPFYVGDLCLIDDKLMEVKTIGVWCTTFTKVRTIGKQQEVIYPNSQLATKNVINHKTEFDWNDDLEFTLSSPNPVSTKNLKERIETYLDKEKEKFAPEFRSVVMLEIGENAKIVVHFKHMVRSEGWTYFQCLKEKEKRRFDFALHVQKLVSLQAQKITIREISEADAQES